MNGYLLDTNSFLHSYLERYRMDEFIGVWDWLEDEALKGTIASITQVRDEIREPPAIVEWVDAKLPDGFFRPSDSAVWSALAEVESWLGNSGQYTHPNRIEQFKRKADAYLIAHSMAYGCVVVTYELRDTNTNPRRRRIKIPDVADALGVASMPLHDLFRELGATFVQGPSRR